MNKFDIVNYNNIDYDYNNKLLCNYSRDKQARLIDSGISLQSTSIALQAIA